MFSSEANICIARLVVSARPMFEVSWLFLLFSYQFLILVGFILGEMRRETIKGEGKKNASKGISI
jgi:hypothetical protein